VGERTDDSASVFVGLIESFLYGAYAGISFALIHNAVHRALARQHRDGASTRGHGMMKAR
jgi:hypothetical protein